METAKIITQLLISFNTTYSICVRMLVCQKEKMKALPVLKMPYAYITSYHQYMLFHMYIVTAH